MMRDLYTEIIIILNSLYKQLKIVTAKKRKHLCRDIFIVGYESLEFIRHCYLFFSRCHYNLPVFWDDLFFPIMPVFLKEMFVF